MSLIPRQVAPVLARLEHKPLPNATQLIVIGGDLNITTRGHTFGDFTISTAGSTGTHIGDHIEMAAYHKRGTSFTQHDTDTPPASEKAIDDVNSGHGMPEITEDPEPPAEYEERDYDWFKSGRLFRIFAPRDVEIHEKQFCLLDTEGNKEGPGLLLHRHSSQVGKGSFLRRHVALKDYVDPEKRDHDAKLKVVYLDAYEEQQVPPDTWIELEHIYNIPFTKYRCTDCGILDRSSLQDLRQYFIDWLRYHWSLG